MTYHSLAEELVLHLPVTPFSVAYADGKATPVYVLLTDVSSEGVVRGLFPIHGNFGVSQFSLEACDDLGKKWFKLIDRETSSLVQIVEREIKSHSLPLERTEFKSDIGKIDASGECSSYFDSPFSVYGFPSDQGTLPIIFATPERDRYRFSGIYERNKNLGSYLERVHQEALFIFVSNLLADRKSYSPPVIKTTSKTGNGPVDFTDPQSIVRYLDDYVIGQEEAKKDVAVAVSSLMIRRAAGDETLPKMNVMLIGSTGTGKTYMMQKLAGKAKIPFAFTKLVGRSTEGYYGQNVSKVFDQIHLQVQDKEEGGEAPYGIVFLDEIDKIVYGSGVGGKFSFGDQMQNELIGWVEEDHLSRALGEGNSRVAYQLNTKNLLFVVAGAFQGQGGQHDGLAEIIARRLAGGRQIGFGAAHPQPVERDSLLHQVRPEDLISWGFLPELVGRFPVVSTFHQLSEEQRVRILTEAKDSTLAGHIRLLAAQGYTLKDDVSLAQLIVSRCPAETGARGLASACSQLFREVLFNPSAFADGRKNISLDRLTGILPASEVVAVGGM